MVKTHNQMIVETFQKGWTCYGKLMELNNYASSLPRSVAKLRDQVDFTQKTVDSLGVLTFENKKYHWCERMNGKVKYFRLFPLIEEKQLDVLAMDGQLTL